MSGSSRRLPPVGRETPVSPLAFLRVLWLAVGLDPEHCREIAKVCPALRLLLFPAAHPHGHQLGAYWE